LLPQQQGQAGAARLLYNGEICMPFQDMLCSTTMKEDVSSLLHLGKQKYQNFWSDATLPVKAFIKSKNNLKKFRWHYDAKLLADSCLFRK
jgi:hypothetical protein